MRRRLFALVCVVAAAACGSEQAPSGVAGGGGSPVGNASVTVSIQDNSFSPSSGSVKAGKTVAWTNAGSSAHTVTADAGSFNSGQLAGSVAGSYGGGTAGGTFRFTFPSPGTFAYHCSNHAGMTGTITVTP